MDMLLQVCVTISKGLGVLLQLRHHQHTILGYIPLNLVMRGRVPMAYMAIANRSLCVVPS